MHAIGDTGLRDEPVLRPGPNDAVVSTTKALSCTSDSHTVHGGDPAARAAHSSQSGGPLGGWKFSNTKGRWPCSRWDRWD